MTFVKYPSSSPYATTKQTANYIGLYVHRAINPHKDDRQLTLTLKYNNRPDLLSYDLYGTPNYWWVFCVRNPDVIRDSIWDFTTGQSIWVPSDDHLRAII